MNKLPYPVTITIAILLLVMVATPVVLVARGQMPVNQIGPYALVPEQAAADMLNNRGTITNFRVVRKQPWDGGQLVVHTYTVQPLGQRPHNEFGFALVELRAGWSVFSANLHRQASLTGVSYATDQRNGYSIIYGYVSNAQITEINVRTNQGTQQDVVINNNGFVLVLPGIQFIQRLQAVSSNGTIIEQHTTPELYAPDQ